MRTLVQKNFSVSGILYTMTDAKIMYNTKFQRTVALSLTGAEFAAASETGKCALYIRSQLDTWVDLSNPRCSYTKTMCARSLW